MVHLTKYLLAFLFTILVSLPSSGQEFADPDFYLIDSLDLDDLSEYDRVLLDSSLIHYHSANNDTLELGILEHIVDNCWHPIIWPKYNYYLIDQIEKKLTIRQNEKVYNKSLYFLAGAISNIGFYHDENGNLMLALDYYHESLKLYQRIENIEGAATTFNNLGVMYSVIGDTSKALDYHLKSLEYKEKIGDMQGVSMSYNNIGTIYENKQDYFGALEYYEASLKIRLEIKDIRGIAMSYGNIGDIYFKEEVYAKAREYYLKSYHLWLELQIETGISSSLNSLAKLHFKLGNYNEAKKCGIESFQLAMTLNFPVDIENSSRSLIQIFQHENDFESALKYAMIYIEVKEKLRGEKSVEIALKKSMRYQYQKLAIQDSLQHLQEQEVQNLKIKRQRTQTYALYVGLGFLIIILIVGVKSYQRKQKDNIKINEQKRKVEIQKTEIEHQHGKLAVTHQEISDSINYAKRIQDAILPKKEQINSILNDCFVFYEPKDVVSGDFYWLVENEEHILFAVADCTGHGVPGAMVSVVCHNALNRVVRELKIVEPAEILNKTREIVIETFISKDNMVKDGMDITICAQNKKTNEIQWAGAYNPLYYIKADSNEVEMIVPDKQPVGRFQLSKAFTNHVLQLNKGDILYLFTDGFVDQFGGEKGKKYKHGPFKELLSRIKNKPMTAQGEEVEREFRDWKGAYDQIDDVCVIGIKI